jgi:hypothetical protein
LVASGGKRRVGLAARLGDRAPASTFKSDWAQYRHEPADHATPTAFYAFGSCLALISFAHEPAPYVVLHRSGPFADAYRARNGAQQYGQPERMTWNGKNPRHLALVSERVAARPAASGLNWRSRAKARAGFRANIIA